MSRPKLRIHELVTVTALLIVVITAISRSAPVGAESTKRNPVVDNATQKVVQGEQIFRFDTFGDQAFWGDTLKLHQAIEGAKLGGVGPGVSPKTALAVHLRPLWHRTLMENHPVDTKPIPQLPIPRCEERLLHRREDVPSVGKDREDAFNLAVAVHV
jgi:hypothetical protein